uniref:Uncharacterized protein n=1 Tax=Rhizophora mucronata TaxID=61149 RepID=A0A2P2IT55_RHIMU
MCSVWEPWYTKRFIPEIMELCTNAIRIHPHLLNKKER